MSARLMAIAVAVSVGGSTLVAIAQTPTPQATPVPVTIIGCVERTMAPGSKPGGAPHFRLIETAPGPMATPTPTGRGAKPPFVIEPQYMLTALPTIDLGKFQNQRVEVLGTVKPAPLPTPPATMPPDAPKSLLSAMQVRLISNECK